MHLSVRGKSKKKKFLLGFGNYYLYVKNSRFFLGETIKDVNFGPFYYLLEITFYGYLLILLIILWIVMD